MTRPSTEDLIARLSGLPAPRGFAPLAAWGLIAATGLAGLAVFWAGFGFRADLAQAMMVPVTLAKSALPIALAAIALSLAFASTRPEARLPLWPLLLPFGLALALFVFGWVQTPPDGLAMAVMGTTWTTCLTMIALLSLAPLATAFVFMQRGATTRPVLTGALAGLGVGALVTAGYALHCTEDSPLFFVTWYGLGIILCAVAGAAFGRLILRW